MVMGFRQKGRGHTCGLIWFGVEGVGCVCERERERGRVDAQDLAYSSLEMPLV
jgi:hypothetical protein